MRRKRANHKQRLEDLDEHILCMQAALDQLKEERVQVAACVAKYDSLLHPVRLLPDDILCDIFLSEMETDFRTTSTSPTAIASNNDQIIRIVPLVCRKWRRAAATYPRLWSYILIQLDHKPKGNGPLLDLGLRIERSKTCSLSIWLDWSQALVKDNPLLPVLFPSSNRWGELVLTGAYPADFLQPIRGSLPILNYLYAELSNPPTDGIQPLNHFEFTPSLSHVATTVLEPHILVLPWSQVKRLEIIDDGQTVSPLGLLRKTINLESCDFPILEWEDVPANSPLTLPHLHSLIIGDDGRELTHNLTLPALSYLEIQDELGDPDTIVSLLYRSQAPLTQLVLGEDIVLDSADLIRLLQAAPRLAELTVTAECFTDSIVRRLIVQGGRDAMATSLQKLILTGDLPCSFGRFILMLESRLSGSSLSYVELVNPIALSDSETRRLRACAQSGLIFLNGDTRLRGQ